MFIIEKAHTYIAQQFDIANTASSARLIGFRVDPKAGAFNVVCYYLIFELENYLGRKYIGIVVETPS